MEKVKHDILKEKKGASLFKQVIYDMHQIDSELNDKENKENEIEIIDPDENPFDLFDYYNNIRNTVNNNIKNSRHDKLKMHAQDNTVGNNLENVKSLEKPPPLTNIKQQLAAQKRYSRNLPKMPRPDDPTALSMPLTSSFGGASLVYSPKKSKMIHSLKTDGLTMLNYGTSDDGIASRGGSVNDKSAVDVSVDNDEGLKFVNESKTDINHHITVSNKLTHKVTAQTTACAMNHESIPSGRNQHKQNQQQQQHEITPRGTEMAVVVSTESLNDSLVSGCNGELGGSTLPLKTALGTHLQAQLAALSDDTEALTDALTEFTNISNDIGAMGTNINGNDTSKSSSNAPTITSFNNNARTSSNDAAPYAPTHRNYDNNRNKFNYSNAHHKSSLVSTSGFSMADITTNPSTSDAEPSPPSQRAYSQNYGSWYWYAYWYRPWCWRRSKNKQCHPIK